MKLQPMKNITFIILFITSVLSYAQSEKPIDDRPQLEKEDSNDLYNQSQMTTLDLLQALELASIRVHKFNIGAFEKEYKLLVFADEYVNGKLIKTDTLINYTNDYGFWIDGEYNHPAERTFNC